MRGMQTLPQGFSPTELHETVSWRAKTVRSRGVAARAGTAAMSERAAMDFILSVCLSLLLLLALSSCLYTKR